MGTRHSLVSTMKTAELRRPRRADPIIEPTRRRETGFHRAGRRDDTEGVAINYEYKHLK